MKVDLEAILKTYIVTWREVLIRTYKVEAENEEDAMDAVRFGDGVLISKDAEAMSEGEDQIEAIEEKGK